MRSAIFALQLLALLLFVAVVGTNVWHMRSQPATLNHPFDPAFVRLSPAEIAALPEAARWDMPMGSEHGALTYNAQPFRITRHLGDDLNGIGGMNSDLGDPVYAAAAGKVVYCGVPGPGWGNMIIVAHRVRNLETGALEVMQSLYAHLDSMQVQANQTVHRGQNIGTVGTANGKYLAHLHFEIRHGPYVFPGVGYADAPLNCVSPERFVAQHRGAAAEVLSQAIETLSP